MADADRTPRLDGGVLASTVAQLEETQMQLLRLLREEGVTLDADRVAHFNMRMRELKDAAASIASRAQLLIWRRGIDIDRRTGGTDRRR
jgi:hypothetical protein